MNRNDFRKALTDILDEEIVAYSKAESRSTYTFSRNYEDRKKRILSSVALSLNAAELDKCHFEIHRRHGQTSRRRKISMLVAILIMVLAMTAVVIAVAKPHIYYVIKETLTSWDITYDREAGTSDEAEQNEVLKQIVPITPEGYTIVSKEEDPNSFSIDYEDDDGHHIYYSQCLPDGLMTSMDAERHKIRVEIINGSEVIIATSDKDMLATFANDDYVFEIGGSCDKKIIMEMIENIISEP